MSDPFFDHLEQSRTAWVQQHGPNDIEVRGKAGWHFCFALLAIGPAAKKRIYSFGRMTGMYAKPSHVITRNEFTDHYYPSTEQFYGGNGQTQHPIKLTSSANEESFGGPLVAACDVDGQLWVYGNVPASTAQAHNQLGLGPDSPEFLGWSNDFRTAKNHRSGMTPVYGEQGELQNIRFVQVGVSGRRSILQTPDSACMSALDASGALWFSGTACPRHFAVEAQFPDDPGGVLTYFRKAEFYSYKDSTGLVELEEPLRFTFHAIGPTYIMAIATTGKLYIWGMRFLLGTVITDATPHEVSGFVDSVQITNEGSGYQGFFTQVTVSDPDLPSGVKAAFSVSVVGGKVVSIRIENPGYGYTSAPTITISDGRNGVGATAAATLFNRSWVYCSGTFGTRSGSGFLDGFSAITDDGELFSWGDSSPAIYESDNPDFDSSTSPMSAAYQSAGGYVQVHRTQGGGIALTASGAISTWGEQDATPDLTAQPSLTPLVSDDTYTKVAASLLGMAALTSDGRVFTCGSELTCGRGFSSTFRWSWGSVSGSAVWSGLWGGRNGFILNREEEFDADGNRINPIPPGLT